MPKQRTINWIRISIAPESISGLKMEKYIDHFLTEVYELPGVVVETEIDVLPGETTQYLACVDGDESRTDILDSELKSAAEKVLKSLTA